MIAHVLIIKFIKRVWERDKTGQQFSHYVRNVVIDVITFPENL